MTDVDDKEVKRYMRVYIEMKTHYYRGMEDRRKGDIKRGQNSTQMKKLLLHHRHS